MAALDFGTAHLYGISGTITHCTVQDFSMDDAFANKGTTEDENGNVIERRSDDETFTGKITLKIRSTTTLPTAGLLFSYNPDGAGAIVYEITKVGRAYKNKGFRMLTCDFITSANVALGSATWTP